MKTTANHAVFASSSTASWATAGAVHAAAFIALGVLATIGVRQFVAPPSASTVNFEAPPPPRREPPPPPPPPVAPPPRVTTPRPRVPAPRLARSVAPPPILTAAATPNARPENSMATGTNDNYQGGPVQQGAPEVVEPAPAPEPPPPPPPPSGPVLLPENATAPVADADNATLSYPEELRSSGVQGRVIIRYVVNVDGSVGRVEMLRGPSEFRDYVMRQIRTWRFSPALFDGHAIAVFRTHAFEFTLPNM